MSKGEEIFFFFLKSARISYEKEYSFSDLKYKNTLLRFDFAILSGGRPIKLIEYDGEQHFHYVKKFGSYSDFKHMQENDRRKNAYCLRNGIPLIRVPYWDLEKLTYNSLFNTPSYYVSSKFHNDLLRPPN